MYRNIPASLQRRLVYSEEIRIRRHIRRNALTYNSIFTRSHYDVIPLEREYRHVEHVEDYESLSALQDVKVGVISKKMVENTKVVQSKGLSHCVICQNDIYLDISRILKCNHSYHIECIDTWLIENGNCPTCRASI